jgi:phosphatidylethanolamine/phosphatidyl-N-methylethanolamine N-methyltransferase
VPRMADFSNGNGPMLLLTRFFRNPRTVGAFWPSSGALAEEMVERIPQGTDATVVELGPGTGALTGAIVDRLGPSARFLAVDIEPAFVENILQRWPEVECVCASAEHLATLLAARNIGPVDHVVSGLPFASLPVAVTGRILDGVSRTLRRGGTFTTFQYLHSHAMPAGRLFRERMSERMGGRPERRRVLKNFPPAYILTWTRRTS